jgi:hypothetical protein
MIRTHLLRSLTAGTAVLVGAACASSGANDTASNGPDEAVVSGAPCLAGTVFAEGVDIAPRTWLHPPDGERVELVGDQVDNVRLLAGTTVEVCGPAREPGAPIEVVEVTLVQVDGMPAALGSLRSAGSGWVLEPLAGGESLDLTAVPPGLTRAVGQVVWIAGPTDAGRLAVRSYAVLGGWR